MDWSEKYSKMRLPTCNKGRRRTKCGKVFLEIYKIIILNLYFYEERHCLYIVGIFICGIFIPYVVLLTRITINIINVNNFPKFGKPW